jgi:hypothetical protein
MSAAITSRFVSRLTRETLALILAGDGVADSNSSRYGAPSPPRLSVVNTGLLIFHYQTVSILGYVESVC